MSARSNSKGCCNLNCPKSLREKCERAVPVGTGGAVLYTPNRFGCDQFSDRSKR